MTFGAHLFESYPVDRLIVEAARSSWYKSAAKCVIRGNEYVEIQDKYGMPLYAMHRPAAPRWVLQDLRNAVRH